ncbi:MAG: hypothetical protein H0W68_15075, partial [Gemmatimonadaceae bacterium]|nr:hypothetical protein [Gemmatimonadaceae bacterium]
MTDGEATGMVRPPGGTSDADAWAYACSQDVVLVLVGGEPERERARAAAPLMLLVAQAINGERAVAVADAQAQVARASVGRAQALAGALDRALHRADEARAQAEEANGAKADFLATMSHELRTPLNAIGGYTELLMLGLSGPVTAKQQEQLGRIQSSQRHLLSMISSILNFARLETRSVSLSIRRIGVRDAIDEVVSLVEVQVREKSLQLRVVAPAVIAIAADPDKLRQILINLLTNAVKF